nr:uncharacterized protein LOC106029742 isoform X2 [Anser cygnoides]
MGFSRRGMNTSEFKAIELISRRGKAEIWEPETEKLLVLIFNHLSACQTDFFNMCLHTLADVLLAVGRLYIDMDENVSINVSRLRIGPKVIVHGHKFKRGKEMREDVEAEWCATAGLNDCQHPRAEPTRPWCSFLSAVSNRCETPSQTYQNLSKIRPGSATIPTRGTQIAAWNASPGKEGPHQSAGA